MFDAVTSQIGAAFLLALLGGAHCAGMCGGFVGALQLTRAPQLSPGALAFGYHAGRLTSYTLAGLVAGGIGGAAYASEILPVQVFLLGAGSAMLLVIGASLLGRRKWLTRLEPLGGRLWRKLAPFARKVYPPRTRLQAYAAGVVWGWIPCGMVYAALPLALTSGDASGGAAVMVAFGIGTLPTMLMLDLGVTKAARAPHGASAGSTFATAKAWLRPLAGAAVLAFGISGFAHTARVAGAQHPAIAAVASICHR
jgi:sulfite exporter TauE/SafE